VRPRREELGGQTHSRPDSDRPARQSLTQPARLSGVMNGWQRSRPTGAMNSEAAGEKRTLSVDVTLSGYARLSIRISPAAPRPGRRACYGGRCRNQNYHATCAHGPRIRYDLRMRIQHLGALPPQRSVSSESALPVHPPDCAAPTTNRPVVWMAKRAQRYSAEAISEAPSASWAGLVRGAGYAARCRGHSLFGR
jgi:hypothetical protein